MQPLVIQVGGWALRLAISHLKTTWVKKHNNGCWINGQITETNGHLIMEVKVLTGSQRQDVRKYT
jgi:hypothetical protein